MDFVDIVDIFRKPSNHAGLRVLGPVDISWIIHEGTWMNSGSKKQMVAYLASRGFEYVPRKRVYR